MQQINGKRRGGYPINPATVKEILEKQRSNATEAAIVKGDTYDGDCAQYIRKQNPNTHMTTVSKLHIT